MRSDGKKVSGNWIRISAKRVFGQMKRENPDQWDDVAFEALYGWMRRFIARKKIKFCQRKCGKEKTAEECIAEYEQFLAKLRFEFLPPRMEDPEELRGSLWGRFPPQNRYNMDQVPLPFVNGQDSTFTTEKDDTVNLKCPKESLRKRQFTMQNVPC